MLFYLTPESRRTMSSISIIGLGNMAGALADRALAGGNAVEIIGRDQSKARELAAAFGDDARAKASVSAFIESLGLRPLDAGGLEVARWLEGAGVLMISLARNGVGNFNFSLGINLPG
ncbi:NAD(P)-binding domain-containing protein [Pseudonocardia cypriaca]|uniref:NAD(P)-binding domain-containing protein n=1 Tax=Pseudonocardia cypriaca TaxID=882449 RepID=UPI001FE7D1C8|nr:NAD(P)-binding domain-containing protein [Pseudonocardia cypriaca]